MMPEKDVLKRVAENWHRGACRSHIVRSLTLWLPTLLHSPYNFHRTSDDLHEMLFAKDRRIQPRYHPCCMGFREMRIPLDHG